MKYWQVHNEQNLMVRVDERMNIRAEDPWEADRQRAQMDYHMFLAHALAVRACRELAPGAFVGPAISSTCTYPATPNPRDVWAARSNDRFKTEYALEMYTAGRYPGYYQRYLKERNIMPETRPEDEALLAGARIDYLGVNYYRTLCASYLPSDPSIRRGCGSFGATRWTSTSSDIFGTRKIRFWKPANTARRLIPWDCAWCSMSITASTGCP